MTFYQENEAFLFNKVKFNSRTTTTLAVWIRLLGLICFKNTIHENALGIKNFPLLERSTLMATICQGSFFPSEQYWRGR